MGTLTASIERVLALGIGDSLAVADAIALAVAARAMRGDLQAARLVWDHSEGRPEPKNSKKEAEERESQRQISEIVAKWNEDELRALARQGEGRADT